VTLARTGGAHRARHRWAAASVLLAWATPVFADPPAIEVKPPEGPVTPSSLELADRLRAIGSYSECAVEALRHGYQRPAEREQSFDRAALCLSLAGRFEDARRLMVAADAAGALGSRGHLRLCLTEVFTLGAGVPACPAEAAPAGAAGATEDRWDALGRHTPVMRALHAGQWRAAGTLLAGEPPANEAILANWQKRDRAFIDRARTLPRPSPWVAGALSAIVPGLGRVYIGRWQDGLLSFLLVGVAAGVSARGFYKDGRGSVSGWVLGTTAAAFYVGNVYGSAVGALVKHREREEELLHEVDRDYRNRLDP
jgi:hypothetical protein